tara:strand:- start:11481 stop:12521 length:1041 start_codon:yes stop_codon:yes gene_type:complete
MTRYIWNDSGFSEARRRRIPTARRRAEEVENYNYIPQDSGLAHTTPQEPEISFNAAPNEKIIKNPRVGDGRANIVFGTDRPSDLLSGYGSKGAQYSSCIDIVVGRYAGRIATGEGPQDGDIVNNSFVDDAARIYISQMSNVDEDFGLARNEHGGAFGSRIGDIKGRSAIAVKADGVRIIGRQGVKIVTGGSRSQHEVSSKGDTLPLAPTIELIAGNYDGNYNFALGLSPAGVRLPGKTVPALQGVAKGLNTQDAIDELSGLLENVIGALSTLVLIYCQDRVLLGAPAPGFGLPTPATPLTPTVIARMLSSVDGSLHQTRANMKVFKLDYIEPTGHKRVASTNVFTT